MLSLARFVAVFCYFVWFSFYPRDLFVLSCPIFYVCLYLLIEDINNPSGLVHVPRSLCFVYNSCFACVYHSQRDEESKEIFREIMADAFNQPSRGLPKMFPPRNTGIHFCFPLSINHQRFLIPQRKERARKEEPKIEQIKGKQKRKWTVLNHRSQSLIHSEYCVYLI